MRSAILLQLSEGFIQLTKGKVEKDLFYYMDTAINELERAESYFRLFKFR